MCSDLEGTPIAAFCAGSEKVCGRDGGCFEEITAIHKAIYDYGRSKFCPDNVTDTANACGEADSFQ